MDRLIRPLASSIATSHTEIAAILKQPDVAEKIASQGGEIMGGSSEDFAKFLATDSAAFAKLVKEANIKLD